jgi:hypothetical protein
MSPHPLEYYHPGFGLAGLCRFPDLVQDLGCECRLILRKKPAVVLLYGDEGANAFDAELAAIDAMLVRSTNTTNRSTARTASFVAAAGHKRGCLATNCRRSHPIFRIADFGFRLCANA